MKSMVLCILDGWGERSPSPDNGITQASTPVWNRLISTCPHTQLQASESYVGLPEGQMGNSEVGHMTIGLGRRILQDLPRIDEAIQQQSFQHLPAFKDFIQKLRATQGTCHLMGLFSPGGVHSHERHIVAMANALAQEKIPVCLHIFLDGRDTPPQSAIQSLANVLKQLNPLVQVGTISGRYYAMDRDKRWDRIALATQAIQHASGPRALDPLAVIQSAYAQGLGDEFVLPHVIDSYQGVKPGDGLFMANFRADRVRQILSVLLKEDNKPDWGATLAMAVYADDLTPLIPPLFERQPLDQSLGEIVATANLKQLRIAETEKYAHVTFFFNGGREVVFDGEDRVLVPSPQVATYDQKPEMSAFDVTQKVVDAIIQKTYALIVVNFANTDMVGHTGIPQAIIKAVETVDQCLGQIIDAAQEHQTMVMITADHGNAEQMMDHQADQPHTAHTCNPVPLVLFNTSVQKLTPGTLADIAPTLLSLLELPVPTAMTGKNLITKM